MRMELNQFPRQDQILWQRYIFMLREILLKRDFDFTEFQVWVVTLLWGIWLANPLINTFDGVPSYAVMQLIAPEWAWGLFSVCISVIHIYGVHTETIWRKRAMFIEFLFWLFISAMHIVANYRGLGGAVVYPVFALSSAWVYLRMVIMKKG